MTLEEYEKIAAEAKRYPNNYIPTLEDIDHMEEDPKRWAPFAAYIYTSGVKARTKDEQYRLKTLYRFIINNMEEEEEDETEYPTLAQLGQAMADKHAFLRFLAKCHSEGNTSVMEDGLRRKYHAYFRDNLSGEMLIPSYSLTVRLLADRKVFLKTFLWLYRNRSVIRKRDVRDLYVSRSEDRLFVGRRKGRKKYPLPEARLLAKRRYIMKKKRENGNKKPGKMIGNHVPVQLR